MSSSPLDWQTQLALLPPDKHVFFSLRHYSHERYYWYARWSEKGKTKLRCVGKEAPDHRCFKNTCGHVVRQKRTRPERLARLQQLPPTTHITFSLRSYPPRRGKYWYAEWTMNGHPGSCYIGKEPPDHPCFKRCCDHPWRHNKSTVK